MVQFIHVRAYPARADWDRHIRRTSSEVQCSTRLAARSAAVHCVHGPMQDILKTHAVEYHKFADDLQIYTSR